MASPSTFIVDSDLHGLVDGHLDPDRRGEALLRLAASPADRARVEAWQAQADLIRGAFAGVDREPLPVMLDLTAKPRLQCVPANDSPLVAPVGLPRRHRGRGIAYLTAAVVVAAAGLAGTWFVLSVADPDDPITSIKLRGSVDATLASRASAAIASPTPIAVSWTQPTRLPTTTIPDLSAAGFSFTGADMQPSAPVSVHFRYQNGRDRIVITVAAAMSQEGADAAPVKVGNAYTWHRRDNAYALAGTLRPARLEAIATALQSGDLQP